MNFQNIIFFFDLFVVICKFFIVLAKVRSILLQIGEKNGDVAVKKGLVTKPLSSDTTDTGLF